jgi:hypothetical protein
MWNCRSINAHGPASERNESLRELKKRILAGARSPGWDLKPNVARAKQDGHPAKSWLDKLAAVISDRAEPKTLDRWKALARHVITDTRRRVRRLLPAPSRSRLG